MHVRSFINVLFQMVQFQAILRTGNIRPFSASGGCTPRPLLLGSPTTSTTGPGITILLVTPLIVVVMADHYFPIMAVILGLAVNSDGNFLYTCSYCKVAGWLQKS